MIRWLMRLGGVLVSPRRSFEALLQGAHGGLGDVLWFMLAAMLATWPAPTGMALLTFGRSPMQALAMLFNMYLAFAVLPLLVVVAVGFLLVGLLRLRGQRLDLGRAVKASVYLWVPVGLLGMLGAVLVGLGVDAPLLPHGMLAAFLASEPSWGLVTGRLLVSYGPSAWMVWLLARAAVQRKPDQSIESVAAPRWGGWLMGGWLIVALGFSAGFVVSNYDQLRPIQAGDAAPPFSLPTVGDSASVSLEELRGKPVVVEFWGTWCQVCVQHMPKLAAWAAAHPEIPVLGVHPVQAMDVEELAEVRAFVKDKKYQPIRFLVDGKGVVQTAYRVATMPTFVVIGPDGMILQIQEGAASDTAWLDRALGLKAAKQVR